MPGEKYSFEIVRYASPPEGFSLEEINAAQVKIELILAAEKWIRRYQKARNQGELKQTLSNDFRRQVVQFQDAEVKRLGDIYKVANLFIEKFKLNYEKKTPEQRRAGYNAERAKISHEHYDPVLHRFEQNYTLIRPDLGGIEAKLRKTLPLLILSNQSQMEISLRKGFEFTLIAVIYFGDYRFRLRTPKVGNVNAVYVHSTNGREYVKDSTGIFVKRYVYRNLSAYDHPRNGLQARNGWPPEATTEELNAMIMAHLRSAEAGSHFISFTTTLAPIFGSTGTDFYNPENGQIIVDLARIGTDHLHDVHTKRAIDGKITNQPLRWGMQYVEGDPDYNANAAARDTVRTREVLVAGVVPESAIMSYRSTRIAHNKWQDIDGTTRLTDALDPSIFPPGDGPRIEEMD